MVLVIVLFVVLLSYVNPAVNFIDAWRDSRTQRSEVLELRQEHERLAAKAAALEDSTPPCGRRASWAWSPRESAPT